jgi:hypothetical protein
MILVISRTKISRISGIAGAMLRVATAHSSLGNLQTVTPSVQNSKLPGTASEKVAAQCEKQSAMAAHFDEATLTQDKRGPEVGNPSRNLPFAGLQPWATLQANQKITHENHRDLHLGPVAGQHALAGTGIHLPMVGHQLAPQFLPL